MLDIFEDPLFYGGGATSFGTCEDGYNLSFVFKNVGAREGYHDYGQIQKLTAKMHGFGKYVGGAQTFVSSRISEEGRSMGLVEATPDEECEMVQGDTMCPSWAESVDQAMNSMYARPAVDIQDLEEEFEYVF
ncbi:hypothetical protein V6N13_102035 [Hibiscus sabdariffa]|uniref:Uncharacterized protein n=1 Tax=Hibiscus sabdariffa TaxID=183260 RepID=A0ABR2D3M2_9ROSI